jgi:hypothetical protein
MRSPTIGGSSVAGTSVNQPSDGTGGGISNRILQGPGVQEALAWVMVSRSEPGPASAVLVTGKSR